MTDEDKLRYLNENTFVNRYDTVSKDLIVTYALQQMVPADMEFCLNGDSTFSLDAVKLSMKNYGYKLLDCGNGVTRVSFADVFEPQQNFYTFKYMVWNGPLSSSSKQCKVKVKDFSNKENIECKVLWIS